MAVELHLDVELLAPATVFFVQRLKSNLGEVLMLMLSSFLRIPRVSALVRDVAAAVMLCLAGSCMRTPLRCAAVRDGFVRPRWPRACAVLPSADLAAGGGSLPRRWPWP